MRNEEVLGIISFIILAFLLIVFIVSIARTPKDNIQSILCIKVEQVTHKTCDSIEKEALIIKNQNELDKLRGK